MERCGEQVGRYAREQATSPPLLPEAWLKLLPALSGFGLVFGNPRTIWKCAL